MAYRITFAMEGWDELMAILDPARVPELKNELNIVLLEETQEAVVTSRNLAPTEDVVDEIEKEFWKNYNRFRYRVMRRLEKAFGLLHRGVIIWRLAPIIDCIDIVERDTDGMSITSGVTGAGQICREIEFGNRYINARPYWRPPIWEAFFRSRERAGEVIGRWLRGG